MDPLGWFVVGMLTGAGLVGFVVGLFYVRDRPKP